MYPCVALSVRNATVCRPAAQLSVTVRSASSARGTRLYLLPLSRFLALKMFDMDIPAQRKIAPSARRHA